MTLEQAKQSLFQRPLCSIVSKNELVVLHVIRQLIIAYKPVFFLGFSAVAQSVAVAVVVVVVVMGFRLIMKIEAPVFHFPLLSPVAYSSRRAHCPAILPLFRDQRDGGRALFLPPPPLSY